MAILTLCVREANGYLCIYSWMDRSTPRVPSKHFHVLSRSLVAAQLTAMRLRRDSGPESRRLLAELYSPDQEADVSRSDYPTSDWLLAVAEAPGLEVVFDGDWAGAEGDA